MLSEAPSPIIGDPWLESADNLKSALVLPAGVPATPSPTSYAATDKHNSFPVEIAIAAMGIVIGAAAVIWGNGGFHIQNLQTAAAPAPTISHAGIASLAVLFILILTLATIAFVEWLRNRKIGDLWRDREQRLGRAISAADIGFWQWDSQANRLWANSGCRSILGIDAKIPAVNLPDIVHPADRAKARSEMDGALAGHQAFDIQYRILADEGEVRWIRSRGRGTWKNETLEHVAGTVMNVSTQVNVGTAGGEERTKSLMHLARVGMMGELSGALAHELNQPLTAIMSNAQAASRLMKQEPMETGEIQSAISDIVKDTARAGEVIRHLRALLKHDQSRREGMDLNQLLQDVLELAHSDLIARHIIVVPRIGNTELKLQGDRVQLQQVFLNLILNAAEAMSGKPGGVLVVSGDTVDGSVLHVAVSDNGPGINPALSEKLFEPFFSTKPQGLGLGLSISRAIVTAHGGTLWAVNNPGHGATFHVTLLAGAEGVS
jgi:signal transduction histidine kinase